MIDKFATAASILADGASKAFETAHKEFVDTVEKTKADLPTEWQKSSDEMMRAATELGKQYDAMLALTKNAVDTYGNMLGDAAIQFAKNVTGKKTDE